MTTLDYFRQICEIPRESGNEEGMRKYILSWADANGFEAKRDKAGNIIVYCNATEGYENVPAVALQGHMDMVCVKKEGSNHDFSKDPIEVYQDGDWLKAKDTSLGGDNGIAVAMTMALFTDKTAKHPKLEAIFTFSEETGMDGAYNLDASLIKSRKLINLDSEEEGVIFIGCAGGIDLVANKEVSFTKIPVNWERVKISLSGLKGGHSGGEIHLQRLNAVTAMARILKTIDESGSPFMICSFNGGTRRNVIPSFAECIVSFPEEFKKEIFAKIDEIFEQIKAEYAVEEPGFTMEHFCSKCIPELSDIKKAASRKDSLKIVNALYTTPHGVDSMIKSIPGIVETSDNLAIARLEENQFHTEISVRSSVDSSKYYLVNKIKNIYDCYDFNTHIGDGYPSWTPDLNSELAACCAKAWKESTGKDAEITVIHAGLECGVINSLIDGMDSVSIGPDIFDVHSVNERVSISSTQRMYDFVKHLMEKELC